MQWCRVVLPAYGAGPYLPAIVLERPVYIREMLDGLYTPATYLIYKARLRYFLCASQLLIVLSASLCALGRRCSLDCHRPAT